jgi:hypothetical protein
MFIVKTCNIVTTKILEINVTVAEQLMKQVGIEPWKLAVNYFAYNVCCLIIGISTAATMYDVDYSLVYVTSGLLCAMAILTEDATATVDSFLWMICYSSFVYCTPLGCQPNNEIPRFSPIMHIFNAIPFLLLAIKATVSKNVWDASMEPIYASAYFAMQWTCCIVVVAAIVFWQVVFRWSLSDCDKCRKLVATVVAQAQHDKDQAVIDMAADIHQNDEQIRQRLDDYLRQCRHFFFLRPQHRLLEEQRLKHGALDASHSYRRKTAAKHKSDIRKIDQKAEQNNDRCVCSACYITLYLHCALVVLCAISSSAFWTTQLIASVYQASPNFVVNDPLVKGFWAVGIVLAFIAIELEYCKKRCNGSRECARRRCKAQSTARAVASAASSLVISSSQDIFDHLQRCDPSFFPDHCSEIVHTWEKKLGRIMEKAERGAFSPCSDCWRCTILLRALFEGTRVAVAFVVLGVSWPAPFLCLCSAAANSAFILSFATAAYIVGLSVCVWKNIYPNYTTITIDL